MDLFKNLLRPAVFGVDAERAHGYSIKALKSGLVPNAAVIDDPRLNIEVAGLKFPNPLGLAAGYDKDAEVADAVLKMGFGFVEIGTITPRPQQGNPKPRVFRLVEDEAVINRLGFNNGGHVAALERLKARQNKPGIVGVNIGANKDSEDFVEDYIKGIETFWDVAGYFTANISSPNTPGLRNLQSKDALKKLLQSVLQTRDKLASKSGLIRPVFLKVAPDLNCGEIEDIVGVVANSNLDGMIISNTTLSRSGLTSESNTDQAGGLSGAPLFERSTVVLAKFRKLLGPKFPIIGLGGINSTKTAIAKLEAGATLVQLYTGLVFEGPKLPGKIVQGLLDEVVNRKLQSVSEFTGCKTDDWAAREISG